MDRPEYKKTFILFSIPLAALIIIVSYAGLFLPDTYAKETLNWAAQAYGQDLIDLVLIMPILLISAFLAYRNNKSALLIWGGTLIYLVYTFVIYCFALHFNGLFILYCTTLGLSFYSFIYFLLTQYGKDISAWFKGKIPQKSTGVFLILIAVLFYMLWLSEIIKSSVNNTIPASIAEAGLPVNPVHVLDLSIMLPAIFITGVFLLRKKSIGMLLAIPMLSFGMLMSVTIGVLVIIMNMKGIEQDISVVFIMGAMIIVYSVLLIRFITSLKIRT